MKLNSDGFEFSSRTIFSILFVEYLVIFFAGINFTNLSGNTFFSIGIDPYFIILFFLKIPQYVLANTWLCYLLDISTIFLFTAIIIFPYKNKLIILLFILLFLFYITYMASITTRNFHTGIFLVLIPFIFKKNFNKQIAFEAVRYFMLFFYFSAGFIKFQHSYIFNKSYFKNILANQFTPYYLEHNFSIRTDFNQYLIQHPALATILFLSATVLEFSIIIGFFTKRFDTYLAILILIFHFANWFIMDIAPIGQIAFISTLFFSRTLQWKSYQI
jgi:hypothetical protein